MVVPAAAVAQGGAPEPDGYVYYRAGGCAQAIGRAEDFEGRTRNDTARYTAAGDTLPTIAREAARDCLARLSPETAHVADLVPLAQLYIALGDERAAGAVIARRLARPDAQAAAVRAWWLGQAAYAYIGAHPFRAAPLDTLLRQLDTLRGSEAAYVRVLVYAALSSRFELLMNDSAARRVARVAVAAAGAMVGHDLEEAKPTLLSLYLRLLDDVAKPPADTVAFGAILAQARAVIGRGGQWGARLDWAETMLRTYRRPAPRLVATQWLGVAGDTIQPAPGRATLVLFGPGRPVGAALRRLAHKYGARLSIVSVVRLRGYFKDEGPLDEHDEIARLEPYYVGELAFPGTIAVTETQFQKMFDGRRMAMPGANDRAYNGAGVVLIGANGRVERVWSQWNPTIEIRVEQLLDSRG